LIFGKVTFKKRIVLHCTLHSPTLSLNSVLSAVVDEWTMSRGRLLVTEWMVLLYSKAARKISFDF